MSTQNAALRTWRTTQAAINYYTSQGFGDLEHCSTGLRMKKQGDHAIVLYVQIWITTNDIIKSEVF